MAALSGIVCIALVGLGLRLKDPEERLEKYLATPQEKPTEEKTSLLNVVIPAPVLGGIAILGLIAVSVVGCYVYFPDPHQTLEDMRIVKADALSYANSKDVEKAVKSIQRYDDLTRKLQVGYYLRNWEVSEFQQTKAKLLLGRLEQLKDLLEAEKFERVLPATMDVASAHRRVVEAFEVKKAE